MENNAQILDIFWILFSATLVLLMQAGFLCLESGISRSKNTINVAMKNAADLVLSFVLFWMIGFGLMFDLHDQDNYRLEGFFYDIGQGEPFHSAFFIFQTLFCATAATIVSGAITERVRFRAYLFITFVIVAIIYPVSGNWAWGGALTGNDGWLAEIGFRDFAGSTVVHSVGGWVGLAALLVVGARTGRFKDGKVQNIPGSNPTLSLLGALFFLIGWIGFNGGSTLALNADVPGIIANTFLAAASGAITAYVFSKSYPIAVEQLLVPINGTLAGLVAITASANVVTAMEAAIIGSVGSMVMLLIDISMIRLKLDDAIAAIPVHLGAGIWGTLCVALFGDPELLGTGLSFKDQLLAQLNGIIAIGLWAFLVSLILFMIINRLMPMRVSKHDEHVGLNVSEHGSPTELIDLLNVMQEQEKLTDLSCRVPVEPFTEVGQIAMQHNRIMESLENAVEQTRAIVRDIRDGIMTFGHDGLITSCNPGAEKIFGLNAQTVIGKSFFAFISPEDKFLASANVPSEVKSITLKLNKKRELIGLRSDDQVFNAEVTITEGQMGNKAQYIASIRDITDRRKIQDQLYQEKERALVTLQSIADGVITTGLDGTVEYLNPVAEAFTGWSLTDAQGQPFEAVFAARKESEGEIINDILYRPLNYKQTIAESAAYTIKSKNGNSFIIKHTAAPIKNSQDEVTGAVVVFHDITAERKMQMQLSHQATHDSLTGLMNRSAFEKQVAEHIKLAISDREEHVLCYLDLDQFKLVNDTCGHIAGDELLRQVSHNIRDLLRRGDFMARLGGDEFGILLHSCPLKKGITICNDLLENVRSFRFPWEDKVFSIGLSIGVVKIDAGVENLTQVLSWADTACYAAKDMGRNRVHVYEQDDIELAKRQGHMQWVSKIREALDQDRFRLYFQTISPINHSDELSKHYEIFIRMIDDNNQIIPPGAFIPAAERYNMMQEIDLWVIRNTFSLMKSASSLSKNQNMLAINLSGASVGDPSCHHIIKDYFTEYKIEPTKICFEITETAAIANLQHATTFIRDLRGIGCRFSLDDFGSGLSSFGYLKNLKVDFLKIDGSFIRDIAKDSTDEAMVKSINSIGQVMGLKTIAEFVETQEIMEKLSTIGINYAQGHYIDRPRPLEQLEGVFFVPR
jgi:Amt family ammonium transporter